MTSLERLLPPNQKEADIPKAKYRVSLPAAPLKTLTFESWLLRRETQTWNIFQQKSLVLCKASLLKDTLGLWSFRNLHWAAVWSLRDMLLQNGSYSFSSGVRRDSSFMFSRSPTVQSRLVSREGRVSGVHSFTKSIVVRPFKGHGRLLCCAKRNPRRSDDEVDDIDISLSTELRKRADPKYLVNVANHLNVVWNVSSRKVEFFKPLFANTSLWWKVDTTSILYCLLVSSLGASFL